MSEARARLPLFWARHSIALYKAREKLATAQRVELGMRQRIEERTAEIALIQGEVAMLEAQNAEEDRRNAVNRNEER